jgi:hypothetical protein
MSGISLNDSCDQLEQTKHTMLQRLSFSDAFFKHQQRGEPDMTSVEKYKIAEDILSQQVLHCFKPSIFYSIFIKVVRFRFTYLF